MTNMFSAIRNFLLETPFVTPKLLNTIPFLPPVPEGTQIKKSTTESFNAAFRQVKILIERKEKPISYTSVVPKMVPTAAQ